MKGQTESTYADHKLPLPPPRSLSSGTNETGTGTALLHYYNVETESFFFIQPTAIQSVEDSRRSIPRMRNGWIKSKAGDDSAG